jgi:hypothetical protein
VSSLSLTTIRPARAYINPFFNHQNSNPPLPCFPCLFYLSTALTFGSNSPVHNPSYHGSKSPPPSSPCQSQSLLQFCILQQQPNYLQAHEYTHCSTTRSLS